MVAVARADEEAVTEAAVLEEPDISASKVTEAEPIPDRCGAAHTAVAGPRSREQKLHRAGCVALLCC